MIENGERPSTIVVGGGYAGIAAAVDLADAGVDVTLLEERRQWGGRATSWVDPHCGDVIDNGQHIWMGCYRETRALLRRLGTENSVAFNPRFEVLWIEPGGRKWRFSASPSVAGWAWAFLRMGCLPIAEWWRLGRALRAGPPPSGATVEEWLDRLGQGPWSRRLFWHPLTEAAINAEPARAPAALLHAVLAEAFGNEPSDASTLGVPRSGLADLVSPVVDALASRGGRARLRTAAREVRSLRPGYEVTLESGERLVADSVVLAVPAADAQQILGRDLTDVARGLEDSASIPGSPIVTATLWFEEPVLPAPIVGFLTPGPGVSSAFGASAVSSALGASAASGAFGWAFDRRALVGADSGLWPIVFVASAARSLLECSAGAIVERARTTLRDYRITSADPVFHRVIKEPRATPAFTPATQAFRPRPATRQTGLAVAGDWTNTGLPATLESAVRSGRAAARAVLSGMLLPCSPSPSR